MAKTGILALRIDQKTLDDIETIKKYSSYGTTSEAVREALRHYASHLSREDYELEVYKYAFHVSSKFARKQGMFDEWANAIYGTNRGEAIRKFKRWKKTSLKAVKTPNKGD